MGNGDVIVIIVILVIGAFAPCCANIMSGCRKLFDLDEPDVTWIVCMLALSLFVFCFFYTSSVKTVKEDSVLTRPVSGSTYVSISAPNRWGKKTLTYVNDNGKEVSMKIGEDTEIYHKDGKQSKIKYIQKDYYTVINHKISSEITEVTIYETK